MNLIFNTSANRNGKKQLLAVQKAKKYLPLTLKATTPLRPSIFSLLPVASSPRSSTCPSALASTKKKKIIG